MKNFQLYSKYYDLLYRDKDYQTETDYVSQTILKYNPDVKTILELGCGSGSHAKYLVNSGFEVTGIERSSDMVNAAEQKNISGFNIVESDISAFQLSKKFDAAVSLFHVVDYLTDNESLHNCFKLTNQHLEDGGIFLFDIWYSPAVYMQGPETRIKRMENEDIQITRIAESVMKTEANVVEVSFEVLIKDKKNGRVVVLNEVHPMRHFSIPEIELLAYQTGFKIIKTEEFLSGKAPSSQTWGICCVLKKINPYV